uniref:Putative cytochrome P450 75B n=1 Tax=Punica granatum TaxID=22663 RepID=A0A2L0P0T5_PUNGR|nr:putative cytochrome P450 75B [Punica granatum]
MEPYDYYYYILLPIFFFLIRSLFHKPSGRKLPPGPRGFPILGSLPHLGPNVHESLFHMAKRHGPLITLRLGAISTVVASSPEVAREIIGKNDYAFSERTVPDAIAAQPNPEFTLGWVSGDHAWRNRRRICTTHLFSSHRLDALQHLRYEKVQQLLNHVNKYRNTGKAVDIGKVAFGMSLNLVSSTLFSADIVDPEFESAQEFKEVVSHIMEDGGKPNLSDYFPLLRWFDLQGIRRHIKSSYKRLHEILEEIIEKRLNDRAAGTSIIRNDDFLDVLLDQCQEEGSGFDRQNIKALIVELFVAGSDTTAITIEWAMAELLRKPSVLQKARQEILTVVGTERPVQESDIDTLPYLQAIIKETLRLHPAGPLMLPYRAKTDTEVLGYTIPRGIQVLVNAWAIARDSNYWIEPMEFRPERFTGSTVDYKGLNFELGWSLWWWPRSFRHLVGDFQKGLRRRS